MLQQCGALGHTQFESLGAIRDFYGDNVWSKGIWPGNSPDLNPIENIWSVLQNSVLDPPAPKNRTELINRVTKAWDSISDTFLSNLYHSYKTRIDELNANSGKATSY